MRDPFTFALRLQQAALKNFAAGIELYTENYVHWLVQQQRLLHTGWAHRRSEDEHEKPKAPPCGADLTDHYGKRSHDVDVEHI